MITGKELLELVEDGHWKGLPQWKCRLCPFDSLSSKDAVVEHILSVHLPAPAKRPAGRTVLVDSKGEPLLVDGADAPETSPDGEEGQTT